MNHSYRSHPLLISGTIPLGGASILGKLGSDLQAIDALQLAHVIHLSILQHPGWKATNCEAGSKHLQQLRLLPGSWGRRTTDSKTAAWQVATCLQLEIKVLQSQHQLGCSICDINALPDSKDLSLRTWSCACLGCAMLNTASQQGH